MIKVQPLQLNYANEDGGFMILTDDMKRIVIKKITNGILFLYLFFSISCIMRGLIAYKDGRLSMLLIVGLLLFFGVCCPRFKFIYDIKHDNITVTKMTVIDKHEFRTGHRRVFLYLSKDGETLDKRLHVLGRVYQTTDIGDEVLFIESKTTHTYCFMKEFDIK